MPFPAQKMDETLGRAVAAPRSLTILEMARFLSSADSGVDEALFAAAREVKARCGKTEVLPRGLVETSNVCRKNCLYCGIRRDNGAVPRYRLTESEVLECVEEAKRRGWNAVAFQSGEIESEANTAFYERLLKEEALSFSRDRNVASPLRCVDKGDATFLSREKELSTTPLEVTLSLGEQSEDVYSRWKTAAGDRVLRYLIRIETSNRELYAKIHPADHSYDRRLECIRTLKRLGYVTGSGVMIGLPGQTVEDLANDIVFFGRENLDMVGMGPYVPDPATPLGVELGVGERRALCSHATGMSRPLCDATDRGDATFLSREDKGDATFLSHENKESAHHCPPPLSTSAFNLSLRMIALTRLYLHDVNIVAATALEALCPDGGREKGIAAGANVVMTDLTPAAAKRAYALYPGKAAAR